MLVMLLNRKTISKATSVKPPAQERWEAKTYYLQSKLCKCTYLVRLCSSPFHQAHIMGSQLCPGLFVIGNLQENKKKS